MKLIDTDTRECIAEIMTDSISIDAALDLMRFEVSDDGQIYDVDNGVNLNAWYDNLEMVY